MIERIKHNYKTAKRIALLAMDNTDRKWYHVFSVFELLPEDISPYTIPNEKWHENKIVRSTNSKNQDEYSFYLIVNNLTVDDALNSFSSPFLNPVFDGQANHFFNDKFIKEPHGESPLVIPPNLHRTESLSAVLPKRNSGMYLWCQIDSERKVENIFANDASAREIKAISQLTQEWLGFDISSYTEHLGNIYLAAPNPFFRDLDISLSTTPVGIFYHLKMRKSINQKFLMRILDVHGDNVALDRIFSLEKTLGLVELPHEPHLVEIRIYTLDNDLVYISGPFTFIKAFQTNMSIKQADFRIKTKAGESEREFVVEKYSKAISTIVGKPTSFNAPYYFKDAQSKRKDASHIAQHVFNFFPGGKTPGEITDLKSKAKTIIRDIMNRANENCYVCDPYFNINDLVEYAVFVKDTGVDIRIINSKGSKFVDKEKAFLLNQGIQEYNSKSGQKIECRMLRGDSILHDRFVVCDRTVWYLGSSFSEFGKRATCLAKVPSPDDELIVKEIEKWFFNNGYEYTQDIREYLNENNDE